MHAIIEDSGTQIRVAEGDVLDIDPRGGDGDPPKKITFDRVLMLGAKKDGQASKVGTPYIDGATVTAEVLGPVKDDKIDVIKFKRRKGYRVKQGHRQPYLRVKIASIKG